MSDLERNGLRKGKLTLFMGAAPGAGKTQAMLRAAIREAAAGTAVCCAVSGAEARYPDTLALLKGSGLPGAPERGGELDVEQLMETKPGLVVVDRLEARNSPQTLRSKRYMDVEALLLNGIDVYAALNVGHVESLNALASRILGQALPETVPDAFVEQADTLRIADAPPEEMIRRSGQSPSEVGALSAMREMLFRYAAERTDSHLDDYLHGRRTAGGGIAGPWPVAEKVMVAIGPAPSTEELLRIGRRTAAALKTGWFAVYVRVPEGAIGTGVQRQGEPERNLRLAKELGAQVSVIEGTDVAGELLRFAEQHHVRQLLVGESIRPRFGMRRGATLAEKLVRASRDVHIRVVPNSGQTRDSLPDRSVRHHSSASLKSRALPRWSAYGLITLLTVVLTLVMSRYADELEIVNIALIYLFPVLLSAVYGGLGPALFAAGIGVLALDFFFVAPQLSFTVSDLRYLISFGVYLSVAGLTASMAERLKRQAVQAHQREAHTASLYAFSQQIGAVSDVSSLLDGVTKQLSQTIGAETAVYLPDESGALRRVHVSSAEAIDSGERVREEEVVVRMVYEEGEEAGQGSHTLRELPGRYLPLRTEDRTYGVLVVRLAQGEHPPKKTLTDEQQRLLAALCGLAAAAIARFKLAEEAKLAHLTAESERLRSAILDSVSHELRTPLAAVIGSATGLIENDELFSKQDRMELLETIRSGAMRMSRLVQNLLGMVRLESGMLQLRREWCDIQDLIGVSLAQIRDIRGRRKITVDLPDDLPMVRGDEVLLEQVLGNVLGNAIKYSPDGSEIGIAARATGNRLVLSISDEGPGLPSGEEQRVFEKFYRSNSTRHVSGTGLGLAICKGIVDLHGGEISAASRTDGKDGAIVLISLPLPELSVSDTSRKSQDVKEAYEEKGKTDGE
ncbi:ATP-binding protein [Saccharibacillus sacchari]|uniref:ATP-binding protein n=1 Tax=Saccharibacillus sacchari TaxID=456493 RepID=UPI0004AF0B6B|nr:ATP-binding protein [Saccharibacillus sacchari]